MSARAEALESCVPPAASPSFESFYRRERQATVRLAWLLTHNRVVSEDLAQEAFAAVYRRFDSLERPAAYLRTTLVNAVFQWARTTGRERNRLRLVTAGAATSVDGPTGGVIDARRAAGAATDRRGVALLGGFVGPRDCRGDGCPAGHRPVVAGPGDVAPA